MAHLTQFAHSVVSRRSTMATVAALLALPGLADDDTAAKKGRRKRKKKVTLCQSGQTIKVGKKQQANYLADGATKGACTCLNPSQSLQEAINAANPGATLELCPGQWNLPGKVTIAKNLTLVGAGAGQTTLRGSGDDRALEIGRSEVTLKALTITNGNALRAQARNGGGIYNDGNLALFDCRVQGNVAASFGGGIFNGASLALIRTTVTQNSGRFGGGIYNPVGPVSLMNSQVENNTANDGAGLHNGGPFFEDGNLTGSPSYRLDSTSIVRGNVAQNRGGGMFLESGAITLSGASVTQNRANEGGGAFITAEGTLTLETGATFTANTPTNCAGANIPGTCVG